eukprot:34654-Prorocentrum_lima.AAC.1
MTSSLVGSEMCIRDSSRNRWYVRGGQEAKSLLTVSQVKGGNPTLSKTAVSYTHLTLPTICSV